MGLDRPKKSWWICRLRVFIRTFEPILETFFSYSHTSVCHSRETCPEQIHTELVKVVEGAGTHINTALLDSCSPLPRGQVYPCEVCV